MNNLDISLTKELEELWPSRASNIYRFSFHPFFKDILTETILDVGVCKPSFQKEIMNEEKEYSKKGGWIEIKNNEQELKSPRVEAANHYCVITNERIYIVNGLFNKGVVLNLEETEILSRKKRFVGEDLKIKSNVVFSSYTSVNGGIIEFTLNSGKPFITNLLLYLSTFKAITKAFDNHEMCKITIHPHTDFDDAAAVNFIYYIDKLQGNVALFQPSLGAYRKFGFLGFESWIKNRLTPFHFQFLTNKELLKNLTLTTFKNSDEINLIDTVYWFDKVDKLEWEYTLLKSTKNAQY